MWVWPHRHRSRVSDPVASTTHPPVLGCKIISHCSVPARYLTASSRCTLLSNVYPSHFFSFNYMSLGTPCNIKTFTLLCLDSHPPNLMSIVRALESQPGAGNGLSITQLATFTSLVICLKECISWHQALSTPCAPVNLPQDIIGFCADALDVQSSIITNAWKALRDILWTPPYVDLLDETSTLVRDSALLGLFLTHGPKYKLGIYYFLCMP